jgi:aryl-alcohol dehydrogenase-like predicted oxidoreductase
MRNRPLGRTGLFVSEFCLGSMSFGSGPGIWGKMAGLDAAASERLIGHALDAGINFIDTADVYSGGDSERIVGAALKNLGVRREDVVIASKFSGETGAGPNARGASRSHILNAVRHSLDRLGTSHIDLYQIHGFDPATPIEETLRALEHLVRQGLVRYLGVSNWAAWQIAKALGISARLGWTRFDVAQVYYSLAGRDAERELLPMAASEGLGLLVWSPLAGGLLTGRYAPDERIPEKGQRRSFDFPPVHAPRAHACVDAMRAIAQAHEVSVSQVALAWLLHRPQVTSVILGVSRREQLEQNLAAAPISLSTAELARLDEVSRLPTEYPGWMLARQGASRARQLADAQPAGIASREP